MDRLELRERKHDIRRCAYCHDQVGREAWVCLRCSVRLHYGCRKELNRRCPTIGCGRFAAKQRQHQRSESPPAQRIQPESRAHEAGVPPLVWSITVLFFAAFIWLFDLFPVVLAFSIFFLLFFFSLFLLLGLSYVLLKVLDRLASWLAERPAGAQKWRVDRKFGEMPR